MIKKATGDNKFTFVPKLQASLEPDRWVQELPESDRASAGDLERLSRDNIDSTLDTLRTTDSDPQESQRIHDDLCERIDRFEETVASRMGNLTDSPRDDHYWKAGSDRHGFGDIMDDDINSCRASAICQRVAKIEEIDTPRGERIVLDNGKVIIADDDEASILLKNGRKQTWLMRHIIMTLNLLHDFDEVAATDASVKGDGTDDRTTAIGIYEGPHSLSDIGMTEDQINTYYTRIQADEICKHQYDAVTAVQVKQGCYGMATPSDWDITQAELYAILVYLRRIRSRYDEQRASKLRILIISDCRNGLGRIETAYRSGAPSGRGNHDATIECICALIAQFDTVVTLWVPGHSGACMNSYADACAKAHTEKISDDESEEIMMSIARQVKSRPCVYRYQVNGPGAQTRMKDSSVYKSAKAGARKWVTARQSDTTTAVIDPMAGMDQPWRQLRKRVVDSLSVYNNTDEKDGADEGDNGNGHTPATEQIPDDPNNPMARSSGISRTGLMYGLTPDQVPGIEWGWYTSKYAKSATNPLQPYPREAALGCVCGCKVNGHVCQPGPEHVISAACEGVVDPAEYLETLKKTLVKIMIAVPALPGQDTPCACRRTIAESISAVKRWQEHEKASIPQFVAFMQVVTAGLPTPQVILYSTARSKTTKTVNIKVARLIADLQLQITSMIKVRQTAVAKDVVQRRNMLNQEWELEKARLAELQKQKALCAEIAIALREEKRNRPTVLYTPTKEAYTFTLFPDVLPPPIPLPQMAFKVARPHYSQASPHPFRPSLDPTWHNSDDCNAAGGQTHPTHVEASNAAYMRRDTDDTAPNSEPPPTRTTTPNETPTGATIDSVPKPSATDMTPVTLTPCPTPPRPHRPLRYDR